MKYLGWALGAALISATPVIGQSLIPPYTILGNSTGSATAPQPMAPPGIDVVAFGANPSGAGYSTTAIQNAVNAAYGHSRGTVGVPRIVFFPCGTYEITSFYASFLEEGISTNYPGGFGAIAWFQCGQYATQCEAGIALGVAIVANCLTDGTIVVSANKWKNAAYNPTSSTKAVAMPAACAPAGQTPAQPCRKR